MSEHYVIVSNDMKLEEIIRQVRAIKTFPAVIRLYDRVFTIDSVDGVFGLLQGIEVGWYIREEQYEKEH